MTSGNLKKFRIKRQALSLLMILYLGFTSNAQQDCYEEGYKGKAKVARKNMDEGDDGLTCANAAKFYVMLCQYYSEPLSPEEGQLLRDQLIATKKAYNDYGVYCKDIGRIKDPINESPSITVIDEDETDENQSLVNDSININKPDVIKVLPSNLYGSYKTVKYSDYDRRCEKIQRRIVLSRNHMEWFDSCEDGRKNTGTGKWKYTYQPNGAILDESGNLWVKSVQNGSQAVIQFKGNNIWFKNRDNKLYYKNGNFSSKGSAKNGGLVNGKISLEDLLVNEDLSNGLTSFANELAKNSDNPKIKRLSENMNAVQKKYDDVEAGLNNFSSKFGVPIDNETRSMMNFYQNAEMAVAIGKTIFGKEPSLEERLSDSQLSVRKNLRNISKNLRLLYDEVKTIDPYIKGDRNYLKKVRKKEEQFNQYNILTVQDRYIYMWYISRPYYANIEEFNKELNRINEAKVTHLIKEIEILQAKYNTENLPHITNKELAFKQSRNLIALKKVSFYRDIGKNEKADSILAQLPKSLMIGKASALATQSFIKHDFYSASKYSGITSDFVLSQPVKLKYNLTEANDTKTITERKLAHFKNMKDQNQTVDELEAGEVSNIMMAGIISSSRIGQLTKAQYQLKMLSSYIQELESTRNKEVAAMSKRELKYKRKWNEENPLAPRSLSLYDYEIKESKSAYFTAKAILDLSLNEYENALLSLDSAEVYVNSGAVAKDYLRKVRIITFIELDELNNAKNELRNWNMQFTRKESDYNRLTNHLLNISDKDYLNALIRFEKGDFKGAKIAIELLKKKVESLSSEVYLLEEKIHLALNDNEAARTSHDNYLKSLKK